MPDVNLVQKHLDAMSAQAPVVAQRVLEATLKRLRASDASMALAQDRRQLFELLEALQPHQQSLIRAFAEHLQAEITAAQNSSALQRPAGPLSLSDLTLVDEEQAEKDIEISRTVQLIDLKAEWELRELQALSATLMGERVFRKEANPCRPAVYARALSLAAQDLAVSKASRGLFLRTAGFALADELRDTYEQACRRLTAWGVEPLAFRPVVAPHVGPIAEVDLTQPGALMDLRERLPGQVPGDPRSDASAQQTVDLLSRLFGQMLADLSLEPAVKAVIGRLQGSIQQLAQSDPALLKSQHHPAWSLINRIAAHATDHSEAKDPRGTDFIEFVEPLVERLAHNKAPDAALYEEALTDVQDFIDREMHQQLQQSQPVVNALREAEQRYTLAPLLRQQVMHQLQSAEVSESLRRFLMGPWVEVLARAMISPGMDDPQTQTLVGTVDELLWSLQRPTSEVDLEQLRQRLPGLINSLRRGMALINLPQLERDRVLDELMQTHTRLLRGAKSPDDRKPDAAPAPTPQELVQQMRNESLGEDEVAADKWEQDTSIGSLPTVPMDLDPVARTPEADRESRRAGEAAKKWLATLKVGVRCKLFLHGKWTTSRLLWRSDNGEFYMFSSPLAGGMHSMTRRALERLRVEGLATTFVDHSLMQRAVDSVLQDLDEYGKN
ncbi:MAG: DUF1631 family protein [Burkholderiales bacterium]|nr:DUF1631 family protein [Burkholderiales bacterium]